MFELKHKPRYMRYLNLLYKVSSPGHYKRSGHESNGDHVDVETWSGSDSAACGRCSVCCCAEGVQGTTGCVYWRHVTEPLLPCTHIHTHSLFLSNRSHQSWRIGLHRCWNGIQGALSSPYHRTSSAPMSAASQGTTQSLPCSLH